MLVCVYCDKPACCTEPVGPLCLAHSDEHEQTRPAPERPGPRAAEVADGARQTGGNVDTHG
ncbi:MAG TPA: hypothetical protein VD790_10225 [Thermoleophilaceae bacterium]|nr:hypothetical protein [Thermoleophilaceae bacterium]